MPMFRRAPRRQPKRRPTTSTKRRKGGLRPANTKVSKGPVATGYSRKGGVKSQYTMTQVSDTTIRIIGRSYLGAVNNAPSTSGNAIGLMYDINPSLLGDRVAVLSGTYDKYCYQNVQFTYVPQCPTAQPGSVILAFERDPEAPAANTQSSSFMQEVMSYEHATLTPAWVSTKVAYKRDPHEKRTWFMSGENATLSARDISQGTFIAYTSNCAVQSSPGAAGKLGFVVMDYTLDLISPNVLPSKSRVANAQQYIQVPQFGLQNASSTAMPANQYQQLFKPQVGSAPIPGSALSFPGSIFEVVIDGSAGTNATNGDSITGILGAWSSGSNVPTTSNVNLNSGSRLYLTSVQQWDTTNQRPGTFVYFLASTCLADAIGLLGINGTQVNGVAAPATGTVPQVFPNAFASTVTQWGGNAIISQQCGWLRVLVSPSATTIIA